MTFDAIDLDNLSETPTIASLEKIIGEDGFLQLSEELGGRRLYIPANPGPASPLAVCLGLDAAKKIGQIYGGMHFEVPVKAGRKARILRMHRDGMPVVRISANLRISIRQVRRIVNEEENSNQLNLDL